MKVTVRLYKEVDELVFVCDSVTTTTDFLYLFKDHECFKSFDHKDIYRCYIEKD